MNNKKNSGKKLVVLLAALVLVFGIAAGGTLAWLFTATDPVVNTFTAGDIDISLAEPSWRPDFTNSDGIVTYKTMPGDVIPKDPTVTIGANSANCYVRLFLVIWWEPIADGYFKASDGDDWFHMNPKGYSGVGYWDQNDNCLKLYDHTNVRVLGTVHEFRYSEVVETSGNPQELQPLFDKITVPTDLGQAQFASLDNFKLVLLAQAVQADGFTDANAAFEAAGIPEVTLEVCKNRDNEPQTLEQIIDILKEQDELYPEQ